MRYLLLIYGPEPDMAAAAGAAAAAETEAGAGAGPGAQPWVDFTNSLVAAGIHRGGEPLAPTSSATSVRVRDGRRLVTDGPFAETKEVLGGYYILECEDLDTALDAAARCPGAAYGTVEVRPLTAMPGLEAG